MVLPKLFCIYLMFAACAYGAVEFKGKIGPGLNIFNELLLPQPEAMNASLLSVANTRSAWNLFVAMAFEGTYEFYKNFYLRFDVDGDILRHGRAIVTNSNETKLDGFIVGTAVDQRTSVSINLYDINLSTCYMHTFAEKCKIGGFFGCHCAREDTTLFFLDQPLLFFLKFSYTGPFTGLAFKTKINKFSLSCMYKFIYGVLHCRLTENTSNTVVLRRTPSVYENIFSCTMDYKLNKNTRLGCELLYMNLHNHKIGQSKTYENNILVLNLKNVLSVFTQIVRCLFFVSHVF